MGYNLFPVSSSSLRAGTGLPVDLYMTYPGDPTPVLLLAANNEITTEILERIEEQRVQLSADREGLERFRLEMRRQFDEISSDAAIPAKTRAAVMIEVFRGAMEEAFASRSMPVIVDMAMLWGRKLAATLPTLELTANDYYLLLHHDQNFTNQAINTTVYAYLLSEEVIYGANELAEFLTGAILHDIGRLETSSVASRVAMAKPSGNPPGTNYPAEAFRRLSSISSITRSQLLMVYQCQERIDGSGMPVGLPGDLIHPWAKVIAVVEMFEKLTSARPQRGTINRRQALTTMRQEAGTTIELGYFRCWESQILEPIKA